MFESLKNGLRSFIIKQLDIKSATTTLRSPATWLLDYLGTSETASGVRASQAAAYSLSGYYNGVRLISETLGSLPLNVYRRTDAGREVATSHPVQLLLHKQPNPEMSAMVFRETLMAHVIDWGNAYVEIQRGSDGSPVNLWPLLPRDTWPTRSEDGALWYETWIDGTRYLFPAADVLHVPGLGYDGRKGYPLIQVAAESIGLNASQHSYSSKYFRNGGHVSMVAETDGQLEPDGRERFKQELQATYGGLTNAHRIALLEHGVKLRATNLSHEDSQLIESMKFSVEEWARWFNLPPHKLKDLQNAHFTNIEHQNIEFVSDAIRPWAVRWEQEFDRKLFFQKNTFYTKHVLEGLLRGDLRSRSESYAIGRNWGWLSVNEIREREEMNRLPSDTGDQYLVPLNMVPADQAGQQPSEEGDDSSRRVVQAAASRVIRYEAKRLGKDQDIYNNGDLTERMKEWIGASDGMCDKYIRVSGQLNGLAHDLDIGDDQLQESKIKFLVKLVNDEEVEENEVIIEAALS